MPRPKRSHALVHFRASGESRRSARWSRRRRQSVRQRSRRRQPTWWSRRRRRCRWRWQPTGWSRRRWQRRWRWQPTGWSRRRWRCRWRWQPTEVESAASAVQVALAIDLVESAASAVQVALAIDLVESAASRRSPNIGDRNINARQYWQPECRQCQRGQCKHRKLEVNYADNRQAQVSQRPGVGQRRPLGRRQPLQQRLQRRLVSTALCRRGLQLFGRLGCAAHYAWTPTAWTGVGAWLGGTLANASHSSAPAGALFYYRNNSGGPPSNAQHFQVLDLLLVTPLLFEPSGARP